MSISEQIKLSLKRQTKQAGRSRASSGSYHLYGESAQGRRLPLDPQAANELADTVLANYFRSRAAKQRV